MEVQTSFSIDVSAYRGAAFDIRSLNQSYDSATERFVRRLADAFRSECLSFDGFVRYTKTGTPRLPREICAEFPDPLIMSAEATTPAYPQSFNRMAKKLKIGVEELIVFDNDWWRAMAANSAGVGLVIMSNGVPRENKSGMGVTVDRGREDMWERFQAGDFPGSGTLVATPSIADVQF